MYENDIILYCYGRLQYLCMRMISFFTAMAAYSTYVGWMPDQNVFWLEKPFSNFSHLQIYIFNEVCNRKRCMTWKLALCLIVKLIHKLKCKIWWAWRWQLTASQLTHRQPPSRTNTTCNTNCPHGGARVDKEIPCLSQNHKSAKPVLYL